MTSQKCTKCGLVSWADTPTCKRCGESLFEQSQSSVGLDEPSKPSGVPSVVSCMLLAVGALFVAFNQYLGPFGYPVSMLAFVTGLGYSIVRVYRIKQQPELDCKRDAVTAVVLNAVLVMVLGAALPIFFLGRNPETKPFEWREYVSARGHYTIQLPDDPEEVQQKIQSPRGSLMLRAVTTNMGKRGEYASGYYDLSELVMTDFDDDSVDFILQSLASQRKYVVMNKKRLVFASPHGLSVKAWEAELQLGVDDVSVLRLYWVKERELVYVNMAAFQRATTNSISAEKFLNSFELVKL